MKLNKKKILALALAVCMVAILSFGTLAWFSDSDSVKNDFNIATSDDPADPDDIFSVDVFEIVDTNGDDVSGTVGENEDGDGNADAVYNNILPGDVLVKEPIVKNTGMYDQYIRVKVTITDGNAWMQTVPSGYDLGTIFKGYDEELWIRLDEPEYDAENDTLTYVFYLQKVLAPKETATLFTHVEIPTWLDQYDLAKMNGSFSLSIVAEAVQTRNVGDNALEAFQTVMGA